MLVGALAFLGASAGHVSYAGGEVLRFDDSSWRSALAVFAAVLVVTGVVLIVLEMRAPLKTVDRRSVKRYGIKIRTPRHQDTIGRNYIVEGDYDRPPPEDSLRLFGVNPQDRTYWPTGRLIELKGKRWRFEAHTNSKVGTTYTVAVAIVGPTGHALLNYFRKAIKDSPPAGPASTIPGGPAGSLFPPDIVECDRVTVRRAD